MVYTKFISIQHEIIIMNITSYLLLFFLNTLYMPLLISLIDHQFTFQCRCPRMFHVTGFRPDRAQVRIFSSWGKVVRQSAYFS